MVKFLTTTGVSHQLEEIIKSANERLVLISPYLKINTRIKDLLEDQDRMKLDIRLVYRSRELRPEENDWLESMTSIRTSYCESLHAKCYLSEREALITSMNLYEFSQVNNDEMGLLVSREEDPDLYNEIFEESKRIIRKSEEIRVTVAKVADSQDVGEPKGPEPTRVRPTVSVDVPKNGFCLRCKTDIPANPSQPYCRRCYTSWKRFENKSYEEKHCHICGSEFASTLLKPLCLACYRKYKDVLEFATA